MRPGSPAALLLALMLGAGLFGAHAVAAHAAKQAVPAAGKLRITGSSTMAPMLGQFAARFKTLYPDVQLEVEAGGSTRGIADVLQGRADIGMVSRSMIASESALYS